MTDTANLAEHMGRAHLTGRAYTARDTVTVHVPYAGPRGLDATYETPRPRRGSMPDAIRALVTDALRVERETGRKRERRNAAYYTSGPDPVAHLGEPHGVGRWADRDVIIAVRADYASGRGYWTWTAYEDLRPQVERELLACVGCAYVHANGCESDEDVRRAQLRADRWGDAGARLIVGDEIPGYAPIFVCGVCGEESEGESYSAVVLDR